MCHFCKIWLIELYKITIYDNEMFCIICCAVQLLWKYKYNYSDYTDVSNFFIIIIHLFRVDM